MVPGRIRPAERLPVLAAACGPSGCTAHEVLLRAMEPMQTDVWYGMCSEEV
jgi:hypothetical protein